VPYSVGLDRTGPAHVDADFDEKARVDVGSDEFCNWLEGDERTVAAILSPDFCGLAIKMGKRTFSIESMHATRKTH
jgi:hypothetical protein